MAIVVSRRGSRIKIEDDPTKAIRKALTVKPNAPDAFGNVPSFPVYVESDGFIYVPRHVPWGSIMEHPVSVRDTVEPSQVDPNWTVNLTLRDYQKPIVSRVLQVLQTSHGAMMTCYCGFGKTNCAIWLMAQLKLKTLVIVHKTFLMSQFCEALIRLCPGIRVGTIQGKVCDVENKHVVLGMLQTLSGQTGMEIPAHIRQMFDFVIVDECHHIAARVFSKAMLRFPAKYTLGLSATPNRKDGLSHVIRWFLGDTIVSAERPQDDTCKVVKIDFVHANCLDPECKYGSEHRQKFGKRAVLLPPMITDMVNCKFRTRTIADAVLDVVRESRNVLVVSDRVNHLHDLFDMLYGRDGVVAGLYIGKMSQTERDEVARTCNVILGTYALTREGLDITKLNTLVLATPTGDVVQTVGRILRDKTGLAPRIIDVVDNYSAFAGQWQRRKKYYVQQAFDISSSEPHKPVVEGCLFCED